ncbi:hypothetical protein D5086_010885 [Populus alba]|uniref:Uncharacterized protein n=2 Tax=Populus alba TaxID=43335 RepID=A0ACC4CCE2_POPAL
MRLMASLPLKTAFWLRIALKRMILRRTCFLLQKMVIAPVPTVDTQGPPHASGTPPPATSKWRDLFSTNRRMTSH